MASDSVQQRLKEEFSMLKRIPAMSLLVAASIALLTLNPTLGDETLKPQTRQDLETMMQMEALTIQKYTAFAEHARKEGKIAFAELLEQTAKAEQQHFMKAARLYGLARQDWTNLADAIVNEYADFNKTYDNMAERAEAAGDKEAAKSFREIAAEEQKHHRDFKAVVDKSLKAD